MAGMQETDRLTLKNGITYLLQDAKARAQLADLLTEVMEKYGADNPPPYPVTSVNGQTGDVIVGGAVDSVNGQTGEVVLTAADVGALPSSTVIPDSTSDLTNDSGFVTAAQAAAAAPVKSVNGETGAVVLDALDIPTVDSTSVQQHITQIEIDVSDLAAKQFGKSSKRYSGTTDAYGNLGIPKTVIDANTEFAVPLYATGGYLSGTAYDSGQIYAKLVRYDGSPLTNASATVYFLV